jgi:hypothetical protein
MKINYVEDPCAKKLQGKYATHTHSHVEIFVVECVQKEIVVRRYISEIVALGNL